MSLAEKKGAIGVILYSDPKNYARRGRNQTYPASVWMPGEAAQLGNVYGAGGDPLTPYYPSIGTSNNS